MTKRQVKNVGASVRHRLLQEAKRQKIDFNRILLLYAQERFLYRLAHSKHRKAFVLKGGALFYGAHRLQARPTKDLGFLARRIPNQIEDFEKILKDVISVKTEDGIVFDPDSVSCQRIAETAIYKGIRSKIISYLEGQCH